MRGDWSAPHSETLTENLIGLERSHDFVEGTQGGGSPPQDLLPCICAVSFLANQRLRTEEVTERGAGPLPKFAKFITFESNSTSRAPMML